MAGLAAQPGTHGRLPRRRVRWRYGLGFVLLLCSLLALVAVGQFAGWIGSSHSRTRAEAEADYRAGALLLALRGLGSAGTGTGAGTGPVGEAAYASATRRVDGQLLDARYGSAAGRVELTVRITGTAAGGRLTGHRRTTVRHCYDYSWTGSPAGATQQPVTCPPVPAGRTMALGKGEALANRLAQQSDSTAALQGDLASLLSAAGAAPGTTEQGVAWGLGGSSPEKLEQRSAVTGGVKGSTVVAAVSGSTGGCVFVGVRAGVVTAWSAPLLAACTTARAAQAVQAG
ncbi:hypothetical protein [Streptacidiphilus carbonis]|uniref:hypothetical protein n=1 Tax=Streptacidiphilus carbonis TaxID=105422 RepID=UPI0005A72F33|nr:hypothetical protein [Streptacidiphilus carbonis]